MRKSRGDPSIGWMYNYAQMLEVGLIGYMATGFFVSKSYFDLFYHMVAIIIILKQLIINHESKFGKIPERGKEEQGEVFAGKSPAVFLPEEVSLRSGQRQRQKIEARL